MQYDVLVIDDEADIRMAIGGILEDFGYNPISAKDGEEAFRLFQERKPQICLIDIWLNDQRYDGIRLLEMFHQIEPDIPKIMISGHGTIETAVNSIKRGAFDFIEKPFKTDRLLLTISHAIEIYKLKRQNAELKLERPLATQEIFGKSPAIKQLRQLVSKVANTNSRVFITGEPGSGKEYIARHIHEHSKRKEEPFVVLNCANVEDDSLAETFFGSEHNNEIKLGLLEKAHRGTLFLDEVTDIPYDLQAKVTRVLSQNSFKRLGGETVINTDVRVMASSSRNIQAALKNGKMREDFYYRLNIVPVRVPCLSERREDILPLLNHFMEQGYYLSPSVKKRAFSKEAEDIIRQYEWPGNIRQLKNMADWLLIMSSTSKTSAVIQPADLPPEISNIDSGRGNKTGLPHDLIKLPLRESREQFERLYLSNQIKRFSGNVTQTANFIGMERSALHRKLRTLRLTKETVADETQ